MVEDNFNIYNKVLVNLGVNSTSKMALKLFLAFVFDFGEVGDDST